MIIDFFIYSVLLKLDDIFFKYITVATKIAPLNIDDNKK